MEPLNTFVPNQSVCSMTQALVFTTPEHVKEARKATEALEASVAENAQLKALLGALVAAQSATVKAKLPEELLALANPPAPPAE